MPRDNNGTYSLPNGTLVNTGDTIMVSQHNPAMQDIAGQLTNSLPRDGSGGMLAPVNMNGYPVRNSANGVSSNDLVTVSQMQSNSTPVGTIVMYAGQTPPPTWGWCDGALVSRSVESQLFAVIGTTYGIGDGVSNFAKPDMRGAAPVCRDVQVGGVYANRIPIDVLNTRNLGTVGGAATVQLTEAQLAEHNHGGTAATAGEHFHTYDGYDKDPVDAGGSSDPVAKFRPSGHPPLNTSLTGNHTHTLTIDDAGGGEAHPNVQPSFVINYIIKMRVA